MAKRTTIIALMALFFASSGHVSADDSSTNDTTVDLPVPTDTPAANSPADAPVAMHFGPDVDARAWCVEGIESHHGLYMYNSIPVGREHAQGWLGWLPSTAASVGVYIGDRASEWAGFRRMLRLGRGNEWYGISRGMC